VKTVFVDSSFWIAITRPADPLREAALQALDELGPARFVTTEEVLIEFCAGVGRADVYTRRAAAQMVRKLLESAGIRVTPQSHQCPSSGVCSFTKSVWIRAIV